jgi:hypothetical protein
MRAGLTLHSSALGQLTTRCVVSFATKNFCRESVVVQKKYLTRSFDHVFDSEQRAVATECGDVRVRELGSTGSVARSVRGREIVKSL